MPPRASGGQNYGNNNRLDIRQRGNATQLLDKYKTLARDAAQQGDRVASEYYLQYADHYFRVLNEIRERQPEHQRGPRPGYDADEDGEDVGNGYNPGYAAATAETAPAEDRDDQAGNQRYDNGNGQREERQPRQYDNRIQEGRAPESRDQQGRDQQDGRQQDDRGQQRDNRQQDNRGQQDGRQQDNRQQEGRGQQDSRRDDGRETRRDRGEPRAERNPNGNARFDSAPRPEGNGRADSEPRPEAREAPRREPRAPRAPREDYRDERPRASEPTRREPNPELALADDEPMISGLPGPATLAPAASAPAPVQAAAISDDVAAATEEPAKRRRGRPRKIVEETPAGTVDA